MDPWWRFIFKALFKILAAARIISIGWRVLEIISQTVWLESSWARDNHISAEQTKIFMATSKTPCYFFLGAILLNDLCVSFGLTTQPIMYSFLVGAGVLGASSQQVIVDIIASMHLIWGRPFEAGDAIAVKGCEKVMSVKSISYKYTFLQAMDGEEIVMPNHQIANTQIQNFGRCLRRRRVFSNWLLSRDTSADDLLKMPELVRGILADIDLKDLVQEPKSVEGDDGLELEGDEDGEDVFFSCWCKKVEPLFYVFEIGYILWHIPDFRSAQHRINLGLAMGLESRGIRIFQADGSTTMILPSDMS